MEGGRRSVEGRRRDHATDRPVRAAAPAVRLWPVLPRGQSGVQGRRSGLRGLQARERRGTDDRDRLPRSSRDTDTTPGQSPRADRELWRERCRADRRPHRPCAAAGKAAIRAAVLEGGGCDTALRRAARQPAAALSVRLWPELLTPPLRRVDFPVSRSTLL